MPRLKSSSRAGELADRRSLVDVRVPAAGLGEGDLEADVRLDQLARSAAARSPNADRG